VKDAALIGAAQRVEHYEIAGYGTVRTFAKLLGENEHVSLLEETLAEEKAADVKLSDLADEINSQAIQSDSMEAADEDEEVDSKPKAGKGTSRRVA